MIVGCTLGDCTSVIVCTLGEGTLGVGCNLSECTGSSCIGGGVVTQRRILEISMIALVVGIPYMSPGMGVGGVWNGE